MHDTEYKINGTEYSTEDTGHRIVNTELESEKK